MTSKPMTEPVTVSHEGKIAWVLIDNPPVNATSNAVRAGLARAVDEVATSGAKAAVLVCAGRTFVAGGDISEFGAPPQEPSLSDVISAIEASAVPWVAAMHGTVFGGGFEIAMGCAYRVALKGTRFALPEVTLGLVPGAGGTQRLPRLIPMKNAIDIATSGKPVDANTLLALGGLDAVMDGDLSDAAGTFAANLPERGLPTSARAIIGDDPALFDTARTAFGKKHGPHAPFDVLNALEWARLPAAEGLAKERALHMKMRDTAESRALRHAFFAERAVSKPTAIKDGTARPVEKVVIIGGGLMGTGIGAAMLNAGLSVTIIEQDSDAAEEARKRVAANLDGAVTRGKMTGEMRDKAVRRLACGDEFSAAAGHDLAIEAVFEDMDAKRTVFAKLGAVMAPDAILATNTSYLDPQTIFEGVSNPERCLGLHFFSPAHIMKLLEIIRTPQTSADTLATAFALAKRLGKVGVLSGICDGFIGNRMLATTRREAEYLLADGALPHEIDAAMVDFGFAMGPLAVQDMAGHQIGWAFRKANAHKRNPNQRYIPLADRLCEAGRFGLRTGKGWFAYEDGGRVPQRDPEVEAMIEAYSAEQGITRQSFSTQEIADRLLAVMANEGALIVEEDIAENDAAVDQVKLHGYGFPRWKGGPMQVFAERGWDEAARIMADVEAQSPGSWTLAERLKDA